MTNIAIASTHLGHLGIGKYVPLYIRGNDEAAILLHENGIRSNSGQPIKPEDITKLVGIERRHLAARNQNVSDLAFHAAGSALCTTGLSWEDMDVCMVGSSSHENNFPGTTHWMLKNPIMNPDHHRIKPEATDLSVACSSGLTAMVYVARALMCEREYEYGLAVGAEVVGSHMTNWRTQNDDLWGDGASAIILEKSRNDDRGIICTDLGSDAGLVGYTRSVGWGTHNEDSPFSDLSKEERALGRHIMVRGHDVQRYVLTNLDTWISRVIDKANRLRQTNQPEIAIGDIDLIITHQANSRIYNTPAKRLGIQPDKFFSNIAEYGNTSSASVFIALADAVEQKVIGPGSLIILTAFGGGMSWVSVLMRL